MNKSDRLAGLDILRSLAIFLVVVTHMFNYTGILSVDIHTLNWAISDVLHYIAMICVPLFLLLTGYLQSKREFNIKHYSSIIPVLVSYFGISAINAVLTVKFFGTPSFSDGDGIRYMLLHIFDFSFGYAWYVEMYISLFMLIPFLNILFNSLDKNKQKWFIVILAMTTMLPALGRSFKIFGTYLTVFPDFLENMYVITYYYIGAYIAKHKPTPSRALCGGVAVAILIFESVCCWLCTNPDYAWWMFNSNATLSHAVVATCVFLMLYNVDIKNRPIKFIFKEISLCSFEMYLISYFTDRYLFSRLNIPIWQIVCIDFLSAYIIAKISRILLVPIGNFTKIFFIKTADNINKQA